ncbi:hypothetical protein HanIR_Chr15g0764161 [Helianthus annuus]|nr:hypothetical protein HanIR_Chr15g0764161 [Helianthus annuus]
MALGTKVGNMPETLIYRKYQRRIHHVSDTSLYPRIPCHVTSSASQTHYHID